MGNMAEQRRRKYTQQWLDVSFDEIEVNKSAPARSTQDKKLGESKFYIILHSLSFICFWRASKRERHY